MHDSIPELFVTSIKLLKNFPFEISKRTRIEAVFPKPCLGWLRNQFELDSLMIVLHTRSGDLRLRGVVGKTDYTIQLRRSLSKNLTLTEIRRITSNSGYKNLLIFNLNDKNRKKDKLITCFGYLIIVSKNDIPDIQKSFLNEISFFIGDYIINSSKFIFLLRTNESKDKILEESRSEQKPGTKIAKNLSRIHNCLGAAYSFYGVITDGICHIEYTKKPSYRAMMKVKAQYISSFSLGSEFSSQIKKGRCFRWQNNSLDTKLENYLPIDELSVSNNQYFFLIAPIVLLDRPIGVFIYLLTKYVLSYDPASANNLAEFSSKMAFRPAQLLFQRRSNAMIVDPIFKARNTKIEPQKAFVLMPFTEEWSDRIWEKLIKPICKKTGFNPLRADDLYGKDIMEDIWEQLCTSRVIVADITGRNANVFYELGIAHTLGKDIILLTQNVKDIPFDLNRYRHIIYQDNLDGYDILKIELKNTLLNL